MDTMQKEWVGHRERIANMNNMKEVWNITRGGETKTMGTFQRPKAILMQMKVPHKVTKAGMDGYLVVSTNNIHEVVQSMAGLKDPFCKQC